MELSANNRCEFIAVFLVFPGFLLKKLHQLFSDSSYEDTKTKGKAGGKIDSDGTDRPETSGGFTEAKRLPPA